MKSVYVHGAHIIDPSQKLDREADLLVVEGTVLAVGKPGELKAKAKAIKAEVINAKGKYLAPGFIDLNCTVYEPGAEHVEDFSSVSSSAAAGGFTTLHVKPETTPLNDNAFMTDFILRKAHEKCKVHVIPMGALSAGREGERLSEIGSMHAAGVRAIGDGIPVTDSYLMRKALEYTKAFHVPVFSFPEDKALSGMGVMNEGTNSNRLGLRGIPPAAEEIIVARDIVLAAHTRGHLHFQPVSTAGSVKMIRSAKKDALSVTAETSPAYLSLTSDSIAAYDANFKCFPPLRTEEDIEALIGGLKDGTIDAISSAHCPQSKSSKEQAFEHAASGMVGLETTFSLLLSLVKKKKISLSRAIELLSAAPAKILGIEAERGSLKPGKWGDFVIFDPQKKFLFDAKRSMARNSPFLGKEFQGQVILTFVRGTEVYNEGGNT